MRKHSRRIKTQQMTAVRRRVHTATGRVRYMNNVLPLRPNMEIGTLCFDV